MRLGRETRKCPKEFQDRLTRMFGTNQFGDPNFIIVWGQSQFIKMGNIWKGTDGTDRKGYRFTYQCNGQKCWNIMRWKPPTEYGSPRSYYAETFDFSTHLYMIGDYPWRGRYEVMQSLISKEVIAGQMVVTHFPLSHFLIDVIIPLMLAFQLLSREQQQAARALTKQKEEEAITNEISERLAEAMPAYWGPVSFSKQGIRTSLLDRKMAMIQQAWDQLSKMGRRPVFQRGLARADRPRVVGYKS